MKGFKPPQGVSPAYCQEVFDRLSELIDGEASPDFCREVERLLGDHGAFQRCRDSLKVTVDLLRECGDNDPEPRGVDENTYSSWVEKVRRRMVEQ